MSRFPLFIAGGAVCVLLGGCLLPQQQAEFKAQIQSLDQRLRNIEQRPVQQVAQLNDGQQLNNIGRQQANLKAELDSLQVDVQTLTGRLEDQQHNMNQLREELNLAQNDLSLQVAQLMNRKSTEPLPPVVQTPSVVSPINPAATPLAASPASIPSSPVPAANTQYSDAATTLYQQALQLVQHQGEFSQSRELFTKFVQQYPNHSLAVNAMYWIGETYYGDKKYENAILQFQDVIQKHPQHPKVSAALMKQGLAFYALGDVRNAQVILQKVVEQYPATPEADKAQQRLTSWQGQNE